MAQQKLSDADKRIAYLLARQSRLARLELFDAKFPDAKPTPAQHELLYSFDQHKTHWITAGNQSGKSSTLARLFAWLLEGTHPTFRRPAEWGTGPDMFIVMARTNQMLEESIWAEKMRPLLDPGEIHEERVAGQLKAVTHRPTGNKILFMSFHDEKAAREKVQSFVANAVWMDEMPRTATLIEELQRRRASRYGYYFGSFTPKAVSLQVKKMVEAQSLLPTARRHRFRMFDNPLYADPARQEEVRAELAHMPKDYQQAILEGDWTSADGVIIQLNPDTDVEIPQGYHPSWRHVEVSDPATASKHGLLIAAQCPATNTWYVVKSKYIEGNPAPSDLVAAVYAETAGLNIVRRVYDSAAHWYAMQAKKHTPPLAYSAIENKADRKMETIANLQEWLGGKVKISPWCEDIISELNTCAWGEGAVGKIVNAKKYHLLDCLRYFVDTCPKDEIPVVHLSHHQLIQKQWREQQAREVAAPGRGSRPKLPPMRLPRSRW